MFMRLPITTKKVLNIALTIALLHLYLKWNNVKNIPNLFFVVSWKKTLCRYITDKLRHIDTVTQLFYNVYN